MSDIDKVISVLNATSSTVIAEYSNWFFVNALLWFFILFSLAAICVCIAYRVEAKIKDSDDKIGVIIMLGVALSLLICAASNITNIISPDAYAIHYLIKDIRG